MPQRAAQGSAAPGERVLVTGATGFLGQWVVRRLLDDGAEVVALVRPEGDRTCDRPALPAHGGLHVVRGLVEDAQVTQEALRRYDVTAVHHLAGHATVLPAGADPTAVFEANVRGTWTVLEACRRAPSVGAVVVASSDKAYGASANLPYTEDTPLVGGGPYEASKACADLIAQSFGRAMGLPVAVVRAGNFYGGGDLNWSRLVPGSLRRLLDGERPRLRSDGSSVRDYIHVEDAAEAYVTIGRSIGQRPDLHGRAFNVAAGCRLTTLEMVELLIRATGRSCTPVVGPPAVGEIAAQYLDSSATEREFGWSPRIDVREGLARTVAWYRSHLTGGADRAEMLLPPASRAMADVR